ncbi:MAG: dodecin family protein [Rhodothermales bacterium]
MSIAKVIEVLAEGDSIEAAVESAVQEASESVRGIRHVYINEMQALVEDNKITKYRINAKVTFVVKQSANMG